MIPLFKSNYSIGKSILTLDDPKKVSYPESPESIVNLAISEKMAFVVLLEDTPYSFFEAYKRFKEANIQFMYGITFWMRNCADAKDEEEKSAHKIGVFMLNDEGYAPLMKLWMLFSKNKYLDYKTLAANWSPNLGLAVQFYDSFLFKNTLSFSNCIPDFSFSKPVFFVEDNGLPFDSLMRETVKKYCANKYEVLEAKSIYYRNRSDIEAYLTFRCITSRSFGRSRTLSSPNLDAFSSAEFCWESYKEKNDKV